MSSIIEDDVLRISKNVEKSINGEKSFDEIFDQIKSLANFPMTVKILEKSGIGKHLNVLRKKTDNQDLATISKNLIKQWKKLLDSQRGSNKVSSESKPNCLPRIESNQDLAETPNSSSAKMVRNGSFDNIKQTSFPPARPAEDVMREKCLKMIIDSLRGGGELPVGTLDVDELGSKIENEINELHQYNRTKYSNDVRRRVFNLRDKKNPALRENVLTGVITPEKFVRMKPEEMASDEVKQMREKFTKEAINEHQMSKEEGTPSDMFKCGKCLKKNCTYTQVQTRSADEPMTTFVYCRECGNRWKFC